MTQRTPRSGGGSCLRRVRGSDPLILRCTKKLLDVIKPGSLAESTPGDEDGYATLLRLDGRKCLLLTHAATLFSVFESDIRAAALRNTGHMVTGLIARELAREGLPLPALGTLDPAAVTLAKTASRSVTGSMTDLGYRCEAIVYGSGGLAGTDLADLNQQLRRHICSARDYAYPIELVRDFLVMDASARGRT